MVTVKLDGRKATLTRTNKKMGIVMRETRVDYFRMVHIYTLYASLPSSHHLSEAVLAPTMQTGTLRFRGTAEDLSGWWDIAVSTFLAFGL